MKEAFLAVLALVLVAFIGVQIPGMQYFFGVFIPYVAFALFVGGFVWKVLQWAKSPVPFSIATTCGQAQSLPWIKQNKLESPSTTMDVVKRMALEVLVFRSLFRNTKSQIHDGPRVTYESSKWLWLAGLLFHYCFLITVVRHMRLFTNPMPFFLGPLEFMDSLLQVGVPTLYLSNIAFVGALTWLFLRRVVIAKVRYISLASDYFPLFLIFAIATTGMLMRYFIRVDVVTIKKLTVGLATFSPVISSEIGSIFFIHVFLVSVLLAYFPFSKLMHLGGVFLSPTRNLPCNSRMVRHINPWNDPNISPHSYASYEDEFREFMVDADIPVEKELPATPEAETSDEKE
jgi:nitrate reductase gamma subunit